MMKKLHSLLLILAPIKKGHVDEVKCGRRIWPRSTLLRPQEQNSPSMINRMLRSLFFELVIIYS